MTSTPDHETLEKAYEAAAKALYKRRFPFDDLVQDVRVEYVTDAKAAISAFLSSLDGYKLMAREPTKEMIEAAFRVTAVWHDIPGSALQVNGRKMVLRYGAMFDAAPDITKKGTE